jgi:hypothetical protein
MAIHTSNENTGPVDYKAHARDYGRVMGMLKWSAIASFIIAMLVLVIIAS